MEDTAYSCNMLTLSVEKRSPAGKAGEKIATKATQLRRAGSIPAIVYGAHQESTPIAVQSIAFSKVLREAGEATIVSLTGLGEPLPTLIYEVDLDPLTNLPRHVDFYAVTKGQMVEVALPLLFIGESPAVEAGANLVKVMHELEVKADPMNLPHNITVDISLLAALGDKIHARDLVLPKGIVLVTPPEEVVALVQEVVEEKEEVVVPADISSIEVEKKGKEEEAVEGAADSEEKSAKG
ncbi:MAG: 50S ribosomal protein L25 [bacterium]|nr:50S ribosomal protein L25 [bacterium]